MRVILLFFMILCFSCQKESSVWECEAYQTTATGLEQRIKSFDTQEEAEAFCNDLCPYGNNDSCSCDCQEVPE